MPPPLELHPLVEALAERIRVAWAGLPDLQPLPVAADLEAISGSLDGEHLFIRNELWRCRGLRKLHLETARLGVGLQILHCVWFPDPRCDLPVFGADIVASPAGVSAAIVDLSPVRGELPEGIATALGARKPRQYSQPRDLPAWGSIFSPYVRFVRPAGAEEDRQFVEEVGEILVILAEACRSAPLAAADDPSTIQRWEGQLLYCKQQKQNDKTRRVLEKAFNPAWADRYIEELLFDDPLRP
jgi:phycocyanobilin:ferredoxin oxidoreductase